LASAAARAHVTRATHAQTPRETQARAHVKARQGAHAILLMTLRAAITLKHSLASLHLWPAVHVVRVKAALRAAGLIMLPFLPLPVHLVPRKGGGLPGAIQK
jgi:hypothetical protein